MISGGALIEESFLEAVGKHGKGMCFVGPSAPMGAAVEQLEDAYLQKYKEKPAVSYYLSGFDAADILFYAIENSVIQDKNGMLHIGRQQLRTTLYALSNYNGITGELTCDQFGDCAHSAFAVLRLDNPAQGLKGLHNNIVYP
jgi:branched-chain amino acid transport system substrate-binding protein